MKYLWSEIRLRIHRALAEKGWRQLLLPLFLCVVVFLVVAGGLWIGYEFQFYLNGKEYGTDYSPGNIMDAAYYLLFANGGQNVFDGFHVAGLLVTTLGIILIAVLTSVLTNMLERIGTRYLTGEMTYRMRGHTVIIGANEVIYSILRSAKNKKGRFLILTGSPVEKVRREVLAFKDKEIDRNRFVFLYGDQTSPEDIARLSLEDAAGVFIIGDTSGDTGLDESNLDCVRQIGAYLEKCLAPGRMPCHVMFERQTTFDAFQFSDIGQDVRKVLDFKPFNLYDMWARRVLVAGKSGEISYLPLDSLPQGGYISSDSGETVHLVVVGMTDMGISLALQAAHICHYPNFVGHPDRRTRITFIDENVRQGMDALVARFPELFRLSKAGLWEGDSVVPLGMTEKPLGKAEASASWLDVEWEFVAGRVEQPSVQAYLRQSCEDPLRLVTVAVCLPDVHQSMAASMSLPLQVYDHCLQILVWQPYSGSLVRELSGEGDPMYRYHKVKPFGMRSDGFDATLTDDAAARKVAYVYDSCLSDGSQDITLSAYEEGRYLILWQEKSLTDRLSCAYNAASIPTRLRHFSENEEILQIVEHNRWNVEKLLTGFRALTPDELGQLQALRQTDPARWASLRKAWKNWPYRAHLDICPWEQLEKRDPGVAVYDLNLIRAIPYIVSSGTSLPEGGSAPEDSTYVPHPADLSSVTLPKGYEPLREQLAESVHEAWAAERIRQGWTYGPVRDDRRKKHPCLVPYGDLPESEKKLDRQTAETTIKLMLQSGVLSPAPQNDECDGK